MEVERYEINGRHVYRIHSDAADSIAMQPRKLMQLLIWLQEHENEIVNDAVQNSVNDEMERM